MSKILPLCALLMLALTPSVKAEPLVVTSGSLGPITSFFDGPEYSLFRENFSLFGGGNQDPPTLRFQSAEVPEPMTITLLAAGLMGLGAKWKFAKKRGL